MHFKEEGKWSTKGSTTLDRCNYYCRPIGEEDVRLSFVFCVNIDSHCVIL